MLKPATGYIRMYFGKLRMNFEMLRVSFGMFPTGLGDLRRDNFEADNRLKYAPLRFSHTLYCGGKSRIMTEFW